MRHTRRFDQKILELTGELGNLNFDAPDLLDQIPDGAQVFFEVAGETVFNRYSRKMAQRHKREENGPIVFVRIKGLAPRQGSRLVEPVIEPMAVSSKPARKKIRRQPSKR